jgi:ABC-type transport system involved in multi-copper enzyme maturation permease subunit
MRSWWHWYRNLPQNPVYLREKGHWGKPNPFYTNLMRFSPFVLLGVIALGFCGGFNNPAMFADNDDLFAIWCLVCIPGLLLSMLTIFGSLMAPALTAPAISLERAQGTWDVLRTTPQSTQSILLAKLFGGLARMRIWTLLLALSLFQGLIFFCTLTLTSTETAVWGWLVALVAVIRPWLEILFAAFTGMFFSTAVHSATIALASSYAIIVIFRLFNNSTVWYGLMSISQPEDVVMIVVGTVGPTAVYALAVAALWAGILYQANRLRD